MSSKAISNQSSLAARESEFSLETTIRQVLRPLASLKLTVVLFALAIIIVLAGTFAQTDKDIWPVIEEYFRVPLWPTLGFAWIDFQIFAPPSFFPSKPKIPGGIYFPGGWLIGALMAVNLLTAHAMRFKIQARGTRLSIGLAVIVVGCIVTWLVIASGSNREGVQEAMWGDWSTLWMLLKVSLVALWLLTAYAMAISVLKHFHQGAKRMPAPLLWIWAGSGLLLTLVLGWIFWQGEAAQLNDSSMRILWQLAKATSAGLVLLAGCVLVFKKRAGIVLLHGGIGMMMFSEFLVGTTAIEGQITLKEGEVANFVRDIRSLELAIVDSRDPDSDSVVVVPGSFLKQNALIQHESLPFDLKIVKFFQNANLRQLKEGEENIADAGVGLRWAVDKARPSSGTDSEAAVDIPAIYISFTEKESEKHLGTHLLDLRITEEQDLPERITVDDIAYEVSLRFKRTYKPYSVRLLEVSKDDYIGTDTPRNYSSEIRLVDDSRDVKLDRRKIWMNNPLRFAGETFYQSGYFVDPETGVEITTLQVVTNSGWMIPYVSCMVVLIGLCAHFCITLLRFLKRQTSEKAGEETASDSPVFASSKQTTGSRTEAVQTKIPADLAGWIVPVLVVLVFAGWMGSKARVGKTAEGEMNLYNAGKIPIVYQGRTKPLDTLARNSLRIISNRQTFLDKNEKRQPAIRWLMDVISGSEAAEEHRVFRIDNLEVLKLLEIERREGHLYSVADILPKVEVFNEQVDLVRALEKEDRSAYQRKLLELDGKTRTFTLLLASFRPNVPEIPSLEELQKDPAAIRQFMQVIQIALDFAPQKLADMHPPLAIPVSNIADDTDQPRWEPYSTAWTRTDLADKLPPLKLKPSPTATALNAVFTAYAENDAAAFNAATTKYLALFENNPPADLDLKKTRFEAYFNHVQPFYLAMPLLIMAFLLTSAGWLLAHSKWGQILHRSSLWLIVFTFTVHTLALIARIYISGRPPVTNLYSSAVFIGWGAVVFGIVFEAIFRIGVGNVISSVCGFLALGVAHFLSGDGDTFVVLQAVLDTQFWLATHVVCISFGYVTTFVAGFLGIAYILAAFCTPFVHAKIGRMLGSMIYGTICFAIFFSFVGTVLGGLWADDSWGRFWGWDPKENGALIIVLWNALVLHARWGGMVKERGLAVLAVFGNIATAWSWFGVNELGVGLHNYGFTDGVLQALMIFGAIQLAIIGLGCLPKEIWWSFRQRKISGNAS